MAWKQWNWNWICQLSQQLAGAVLVAVPAGYFLCYLAQGKLPADFASDISVQKEDHREVDHMNIAQAIGSCHMTGSFSTWSPDWLKTLRISSDMLPGVGALAAAPSLAQADVQAQDYELTAFERAALWQSSRIIKERERFLREAEERQDRSRRNQLRILCLSAAAAFMVGLKTLAGNKDDDAPFRSLMKGALLPISILALLMPVLATAVSGVATFDGDTNIAVRHVRTLAQLEQLHGRIAEDVTSDPFLCPIMRATKALYRTNATAPQDDRIAINPANLNDCLMDRSARTVAWEQRHEQILNDATPSLAHAGDLPRPNGKSEPLLDKKPASGDICQVTFPQPTERVARDAMSTTQKTEPKREPL